MSSQFEFIHTDPAVKLKPGKSLAVRSKVMQGRNKREDSRRSQLERRKNAQKRIDEATLLNTQACSVPRPPDGFSLVRFAATTIEPADPGRIVQIFNTNIVNQALSPLERCADFENIETVQFQWTFSDPTFTHLILTASHVIHDTLSPDWNGRPGVKWAYHLKETLSLLSKRLTETDVQQDEPILYIVLQLAMLGLVVGDWTAVSTHLSGLKRIVQLKGGWAFLQTRPRLHFKLDRYDLSWYLISGNKPFFLHPRVSWQSVVPQSHIDANLYMPDSEWHPNLCTVFWDMRVLAKSIDINLQKRVVHGASYFQSTLSTLQSRLIHLDGMLHTPLERLMRLCMLALLATAFKGPGHKIPYFWAQNAVEIEYQQLTVENTNVDLSLRLWILLMAGILNSPKQKAWIEEAWHAHNIYTEWPHIKQNMMHVLWIEGIHDRFGEAVFERLSTSLITN